MAGLLCDGPVLVEVACQDVITEQWWTTDECPLFLSSLVDTTRLKMSGEGVTPTLISAVAGSQCKIRLTTYDERGRRRATDGDSFSCALRAKGRVAEVRAKCQPSLCANPTSASAPALAATSTRPPVRLRQGDEPALIMPEAAAVNLGNGMHELAVYFEKAGDFVFLIRLEGKTVRPQPCVAVRQLWRLPLGCLLGSAPCPPPTRQPRGHPLPSSALLSDGRCARLISRWPPA